METNNNSTTIGGVTFGEAPSAGPAPANTNPTQPTFGGNAETPAEPAPEAPAPETPAPAAPTDAVTQTFTALENSDIEQILNSPANNNGQPAEPITPTQTALNVPFVSPTSFDNANTVQPVIKDPSLSNLPVNPQVPNSKKKVKSPETMESSLKKFTTMTIVFGVLAVIFLIFGVVSLMLYLTQTDNLNTTQADLAKSERIVAQLEETTGMVIETYEDVPVYKATKGYIYITEWDIKIKIPENLESVSYILDQKFRPKICFNAVEKGVQYFPDFADIAKNKGHMGCLMRVSVNEGNYDPANQGLSFGTPVFTYKDYTYFYTEGTTYSDPVNNAADLGLERTAMQIIKNMLRDNIEAYE
ncbi:MAG: hypothetical protein Q4E47_00165 [Candidatus Saccharibacteria bacterium]|nr:hypothetical protein [Candidatus Saccharibacteria bacterium]